MGCTVYDTSDSRWYGYDGSNWKNLSANAAIAYDVQTNGSGPVTVSGTSHKIYICNAISGITYNLPAASSAAGWLQIFRSQTGSITVHPNGTDNINGSNSNVTVTGTHSATFFSDGSAWWQIASF